MLESLGLPDIESHPLPKNERSDSKLEIYSQEQSLKKYREVIGEFYNSNYFLEQNKPLGRVPPLTSDSSQEYKKLRFKVHRLKFSQKKVNPKQTNEKQNYEQYLLRFLENNHICLYELKNISVDLMKPIKVSIKEELSASLEYDSLSSRLFCFSNNTQEVVVISTALKEISCRMKIKHKRIDPELLLHKYKGKEFLLVIGGFDKKKALLEGCKYIEIFLINKWEITLSKKVLKLNIGRIYPIVFSHELEDDPSIFIVGGNTNADWKSRKVSFIKHEDINFSTNQTGVRIPSSSLYDFFFNEEDNFFVMNNLNIRFERTNELYNGCVLMRRDTAFGTEKLELYLPNQPEIFNMKIIKNEINIIESNLKTNYVVRERIGLKIGYNRNEDNVPELFRIDAKGHLKQIELTENDKANREWCALM